MNFKIILSFLMALVISFLATPRVRLLALKLRVMAHPGGRRVHTQLMPLWGGIAIYAAFAVTCFFIILISNNLTFNSSIIGILVAGAVILTVGLVDDLKEISASKQSAAIIGAGVILILFKVRIQFLSNPFGDNMIHLPLWLSVILTLSWIFLVTKTVDFMDGLDGLAAGIGAIAAGALALMAYYTPGQQFVSLMSAALCGACLGFLRFNFNPAKIFMGTGGSQFIGFALAAISIIGAFKTAAAMAIALPILVLGVPIFDGLFVIGRRIMKGQPIHKADKSHLHHRLLEMGLSHKQAVLVILAICIVLVLIALFLLKTQ